jgi:FAD/FMN-containing dehydrogenase
VLEQLRAIVGDKGLITDPGEMEPWLTDWRQRRRGRALCVVSPATTAEVSAVVALCATEGQPVFPVGGNTGLCFGAVPESDRPGKIGVVLSLRRLNRIRALDQATGIATVDAGVVLGDLHEAAVRAGRQFPLHLGSEGSAQIGGLISTNAGGTGVVRYGPMRDLVAGLEIVLADGRVLCDLAGLRKDNTGYMLRHLFIGAEGTLGIITGAVLKLYPQPLGKQVAFAGLNSVEEALALFNLASSLCGTSLTGFELMPRFGVEITARHIDGVRDPLESEHPWYLLIDISTSDSAETAERMMTALLEQGFEAGLVQDAVIASSVAQQKALWHMRESMSEAQKPEGGSIKHDVSVPVSTVPQFMQEAGEAVMAAMPGARICAFGHMGDGNIHYNISQPVGADKQAFLDRWHEMNTIVHGLVLSHGGSISAEHGIGQLKRDELAAIRPPIEMDLMRRIKRAFDPAGIMNPGKVVTVE